VRPVRGAGKANDLPTATLVPVWLELLFDTETAVSAYHKLARPPFGFLLESVVGGERWARYTFLGTEPRAAWRLTRRAGRPLDAGARVARGRRERRSARRDWTGC
jgi:anthranilate/para-aminobenzoate synthase component I